MMLIIEPTLNSQMNIEDYLKVILMIPHLIKNIIKQKEDYV